MKYKNIMKEFARFSLPPLQSHLFEINIKNNIFTRRDWGGKLVKYKNNHVIGKEKFNFQFKTQEVISNKYKCYFGRTRRFALVNPFYVLMRKSNGSFTIDRPKKYEKS